MINFFNNFIDKYGILGISLIFAIEGLGTPFPTQIGFLGITALIELNSISILKSVALISISNLVGNIIIYLFLRFGSKSILLFIQKITHLTEPKLEKAKIFFNKYGFFAVSVARIIGIPRTPVIFLAGILKLDFVKYILSALLGNTIWATFYVYFFLYTYRFAKLLYFKNIAIFVLSIIAVIVIITIFYIVLAKRYIKKRRV